MLSNDKIPGDSLARLSPDLFALSKSHLRLKRFNPGEPLFAAGDQSVNIYFLKAGAASLVSVLRDGRRIQSAIVGPDAVLGAGSALADVEAVYSVLPITAVMAYSYPSQVVRDDACRAVELWPALLRHEQYALVQAQQSAACNAAHTIDQRLASWLLRVSDVLRSDTFGVTQELMAEMLGVRRTSVSTTANHLQQAGLIGYRRGRITIRMANALRDKACECYSTIRKLERLVGRRDLDNQCCPDS